MLYFHMYDVVFCLSAIIHMKSHVGLSLLSGRNMKCSFVGGGVFHILLI